MSSGKPPRVLRREIQELKSALKREREARTATLTRLLYCENFIDHYANGVDLEMDEETTTFFRGLALKRIKEE